jgi:hypothetical protein
MRITIGKITALTTGSNWDVKTATFAEFRKNISTYLHQTTNSTNGTNMYYRSLYFISICNGPHHFTNLTQAASGVELCHRPVMARGTA